MKKLFAVILAVMMVVAAVLMVACNNKKSEVQKIIEQAQNMTMEELAAKAIEESNGKTFYGLGNSSRGKSALPYFISYLQTIDSSYTLKYEWQQPKNNKIFTQLDNDSKKAVGTYAMTLIQDGNQIESKMVQPGILDTFIPKAWAKANNIDAKDYKGYLALQTLNKVFMYNCKGTKTYNNVWDFVATGEHGMFMDVDSEVVGKNFLYMLTNEKYANQLKEAYDAMPAGDAKTRIADTVAELEKDEDVKTFLGDLCANAKYGLAWTKLWVNSYNAVSDDGPICKALVDESAADQFGLLVYSKLRSVEESATVSKNNIKVAAYEDGYNGFGGYAYCHYLFVTDNSPLPWTACAFIAYMTTVNESEAPASYLDDGKGTTHTADQWKVAGFEAWGKDIGGYSSNPDVARINEQVFKHSVGGMDTDGTTVKYKALNDKGYDWWESRLVIEDPEYCASVAFTVGNWIEVLDRSGLKSNI